VEIGRTICLFIVHEVKSLIMITILRWDVHLFPTPFSTKNVDCIPADKVNPPIQYLMNLVLPLLAHGLGFNYKKTQYGQHTTSIG
jgi:hypothetical protein